MLTTVTSHVIDLAAGHAISALPLGHLPSSVTNSDGSLTDGTLALHRARQTRSVTSCHPSKSHMAGKTINTSVVCRFPARAVVRSAEIHSRVSSQLRFWRLHCLSIGHRLKYLLLLVLLLLCTPWAIKKTCHFYFYNNFGKCGPISIILSLLDS